MEEHTIEQLLVYNFKFAYEFMAFRMRNSMQIKEKNQPKRNAAMRMR